MSVIASSSKVVKFHQWPEGVLQQSYLPRSYDGYVQSISWGKDGSWVVVVPDAGPAEVITIKDNTKLLQTIQDVSRPSCATFHTTTKKLIGIGTVCGQTMIYDIKSKCIKKRFPRVSSKICSLCYNSKDTHIAAVCNNGEILLLSNLAGNISNIYKVPNSNSVCSANFHRVKRNYFAAGSDVGIVAAWDINSNQMMCNIQAHQAPASSLTFSPLHHDLLVTGGLDRKFTFYDIRTQKQIKDVEVTNAITSLDYSHCGVYLGIGFQNGNIAIYDARKSFNKSLTVFEAHPGNGIRHLRFQKVLSDSLRNNSVYDIILEEVSPSVQDAAGEYTSSIGSVFDSVGIVSCEGSNTQVNSPVKKKSQDLDDSFMIALGLEGSLEGSNRSTSLKNDSNLAHRVTNEYKKLLDVSRHYSLSQHASAQHGSLQLTKNLNIQISSTPKHPDLEVQQPVESPILTKNETIPVNHHAANSIPDDLHKMIRDIVRQEVRDIVRQEVREIICKEVQTQTELLKSTIKDDLTNMLGHVRRHFLDLQMTIVREFVNIEELIH